jgi:hypothetical protein
MNVQVSGILGFLFGGALIGVMLVTGPVFQAGKEALREEKAPIIDKQQEPIIHIHVLDRSACKAPV